MKPDNIIDGYVAREKGVEPSPYLESRIMAKIKSAEEPQPATSPVVRFLKGAAVAAGFAAAVGLGILAGSSYTTSEQDRSGLMVNDSAIERFSIYSDDESE